jgi:hypothetical protein
MDDGRAPPRPERAKKRGKKRETKAGERSEDRSVIARNKRLAAGVDAT